MTIRTLQHFRREMTTTNPPDNNQKTPLLTVTEATKYLGIGRTALYGLVKQGSLQKVKVVQGRTQFLKLDLDNFINSKKA